MPERPPWGCVRAAGALAVALTLAAPSQVAAHGGPEAHLEPGFPLYDYKLPGTGGGQEAGDNVLLGNVDADPEAEIFVPSSAVGPLFAWNGDGSPLSGWPMLDVAGFPFAGLGDLSPDSPALDVFVGTWQAGKIEARAGAFTSEGRALPGWPLPTGGETYSVPALDDVDGDGLDEIFIVGNTVEDLMAYRHDGSVLPGWGVRGRNVHEFTTPAIADLDGTGDPEVVAAADGIVHAWNADGSEQAGFPAKVAENAPVQTPVAVGDVDGDGALEIIVVNQQDGAPWHARVAIVTASGSVERVIEVPADVRYGAAPALADLAGDDAPEIVLHADNKVYAWHGDGALVEGWPVAVAVRFTGVSPVVGDVDGDPEQEVVVLSHPDSGFTRLDVISAAGDIEPGFPWELPVRYPNMPAVGDVDGDRRNEIVVVGEESNYIGYNLGVLAYDLGGGPHGDVEWGQFGGGPRHQGRYGGLHAPRPLPEPTGSPAAGPTHLVRDIAAGAAASEPREPEPYLDRLFFQAEDGQAGAELWASDGTATGTGRVKDIRSGAGDSRPRELTRVGSTLYFVADDGSTGAELWKTDGTPAGTQRVHDIWPGPRGSAPRHLTAFGGELYFSAWDGEHGYELWRSDGTAAGTRMVANMLVGSGATAHEAGAGSDPTHILPFEGELYFSAFTVDPWYGQYGLWRLPAGGGEPQPVERMGEVTHNPWRPMQVVESGGRLWMSNGADVSVLDDEGARTVFAEELDPWVTRFVPFRNGIVFGAKQVSGPHGVWRIAGAAATASVLGPPPAPAGRAQTPGYTATLGGRVLVSGAEDAHGTELWRSDGTPGSMNLLADIQAGPGSSAPSLLTRFGGELLFTADDGHMGREPWITDGSAAGTMRLQDIAPGRRGSNVEWFAHAGGSLFFSADDGEHGQELWAMPFEPSEEPEVPEEPDEPDEPEVPEVPEEPGEPSEPGGHGGPEDRSPPSLRPFVPSEAPADRSAPLIQRLKLRPRELRLSLHLSEAGRLRVEIRRRLRSGRPGKRIRTLTLEASRGVNHFRLGKALAPGRYLLRVVAVDSAGNRGRVVGRAFVAGD